MARKNTKKLVISFNDPSIPEVQWLQKKLKLCSNNLKFTEKRITLQSIVLDLGGASEYERNQECLVMRCFFTFF